MKKSRIIIAVLLILVMVGVVLGVTSVQYLMAVQPAGTSTPLPAGSIPLYLDGRLLGGFTPNLMDRLPTAQFTDVYEEKPQDGWMLSQVILLMVSPLQLKPDTQIVVSSSSQDKAVTLTWEEVQDPANYVMFDLSNRGTLKLVSVLPQLEGRNEWVQDVDSIEINNR